VEAPLRSEGNGPSREIAMTVSIMDSRAKRITDKMKNATVNALSNYITDPTPDCILPDILNRNVTISVARTVKDAA
jgi:malate dehydrogenase (oxaloacetate-decarboxylating)